MNRSFFKICDRCGASLDPGEICDCMKEKRIPRLEMLAEQSDESAKNGKTIYEIIGDALESFTTKELAEYVSGELKGETSLRYYLENQIIGAAINYMNHKKEART